MVVVQGEVMAEGNGVTVVGFGLGATQEFRSKEGVCFGPNAAAGSTFTVAGIVHQPQAEHAGDATVDVIFR